MPNLYATPTEIKAAMPDGIRAATTSYDNLLLTLASRISRFVDNHCNRKFYPSVATRYYDGSGTVDLKIADLLEITTISYSEDYGSTYTALVAGDYIATHEGDYNSDKSYTLLRVNANSGTLSTWPTGQRSIKIVGIWAYADDRTICWEDSLDTVENNPLAIGGTTVNVNDADGVDLNGITPRFQLGQLLKIESEYLEAATVTAAATNTVVVARGRNGSTAAAHVQNTAIYIWRPPEPVKQAVIIQAVRQMERGFQGFGDARASAEVGTLFFLKSLDPEVQVMLQEYVWKVNV